MTRIRLVLVLATAGSLHCSARPTPQPQAAPTPSEPVRATDAGEPADAGYTIGKDGPFNEGDAVIVSFDGTSWYQAHVEAVDGNTVVVRFDDDPANSVSIGAWKAFDRSRVRHRIGGSKRYVNKIEER
jgi:hypothetical protein